MTMWNIPRISIDRHPYPVTTSALWSSFFLMAFLVQPLVVSAVSATKFPPHFATRLSSSCMFNNLCATVKS
jgi:hypothetical protein